MRNFKLLPPVLTALFRTPTDVRRTVYLPCRAIRGGRCKVFESQGTFEETLPVNETYVQYELAVMSALMDHSQSGDMLLMHPRIHHRIGPRHLPTPRSWYADTRGLVLMGRTTFHIRQYA